MVTRVGGGYIVEYNIDLRMQYLRLSRDLSIPQPQISATMAQNPGIIEI